MPSTTTKKAVRRGTVPPRTKEEDLGTAPAEAPSRRAGRHARRQLPQTAAGLRGGARRRARDRLQRDRRASAAHPLGADPGPAGRRPRGQAQRAAPARTGEGGWARCVGRGQQPGHRPRPPDGRVRPGGRGGVRRRPDPADGPAARRAVPARGAAAGRPKRERAGGPAVHDRRRDHQGDPRGRHRGQARRPGAGPGLRGQLARPDRRGQHDVLAADRPGPGHRPGHHRGRRRRPVAAPSPSRCPARWPSSRTPSTGWSTSCPRSPPR